MSFVERVRNRDSSFQYKLPKHNFPYLTYKILNRLRASANTNNNLVDSSTCVSICISFCTFLFGYKNHDHAQIHNRKKCTNQKHRFIFIRLKARKGRQLLVNIHSSKFILRLELRAKEHDQEDKYTK